MNDLNQKPEQEQKHAQKSCNAHGHDKAWGGLDEEAILSRAYEILDRRVRAGALMADPAMAGRVAALRLRGREREVFLVMFLDTRHRMIHCEEMFLGTIDQAEVHPREIARAALKHNASAIICAHNHPSGSPEPSAADRGLSARLKNVLALIEVRVLDHFIIGDGAPISMALAGLI